MLLIFLIGMILAGNRMPFIMYIFTLSLITDFSSKLKKIFFNFSDSCTDSIFVDL